MQMSFIGAASPTQTEASMQEGEYQYGLSVRDLFVGDEVRMFKNGATADDIAQVSTL